MTSYRTVGAVALIVACLLAQHGRAEPSLVLAIQRGDTALVARLIERGINLNSTDEHGTPALMLATLFADAECVRLLLTHGADPNQGNGSGATPLMWAIPDIEKARLLIARGADVNARSGTLGRTPFLIAAGYPGTVELLRLLLDHGADTQARDSAGFSALAMAMQASDMTVLQFLIERGADPKAKMPVAAVRGAFLRQRPAVVDYLMSHGLDVPSDALLRATNWQRPDLLARWLAAGADVNARENAYGRTPLFTAASSELAGADTLRLLLEHGADPNVPMSEGERPLDWAVYRNDREKISMLEQYGATRGTGPRSEAIAPPTREQVPTAQLAVARSLAVLLKSAPPMFETRKCYTCHHNTLPAELAALARRKGIAVDESLEQRNLTDIQTVLRAAAEPAMQAHSTVPGGIVLTVGYGLMALAAEGYPPDTMTAALIHWILSTQMPDGTWLGNGVNRPPMESSIMSHTAIAVRGLTLYPIPGRKLQIDRALENAREWLVSASATTAEDRAMRLIGLVWTKAPDPMVKTAADDVLRQQQSTGGWSQLVQLEPDAYATGLSLVALHQAGIPVTEAAYQKGIGFLLNTQYADGSWLVRTRAFPVQPYMESGFPFGRHQWISAAGTAWAALAIAETLPDTKR